MKFSIIIPTKNRQAQAIEAIKSCINSRYENIEIIVTDGSDDGSLRKSVRKLNDARIKYFYHSKSLAMKLNWEFGVTKATGDFVGIIGDDDALMPDGLVFASELLAKFETPVLHCSAPIYAWDDYQFINRKNLITVKLPMTITHCDKPHETLRKFYEFKGRSGTGPGIYHGLVKRTFLNKLKRRRGSFFKEDNPDLDSGLSTLLYADRFVDTTYPIYLSGTCGASNSAAMNDSYKSQKANSVFTLESCKKYGDIIWSDVDKIQTIDAGILSAMRRFLPEVNKVIRGGEIKLNKQNMFNLLCDGVGTGYDTTTFNVQVAELKDIAKKWKVSDESIPSPKLPSLGIMTDKGPNLDAIRKNSNVNKIGIDGNALGVKNIHDAIKVIDSLSTDWLILLDQLQFTKGLDHPTKKFRGGSLDVISDKLAKNETKKAKKMLETNIMGDATDPKSLLFLGVTYFNEKNFEQAIPFLARSLSLEFHIKAFDAYFHCLINVGYLDLARMVIENYKNDLVIVNNKLPDHCTGVLEMEAGNYEMAADIFKKINPPIDSSLYYFCAAHAKFVNGDAINADKLVKKALHLNDNKKEFLDLEAKIGSVI